MLDLVAWLLIGTAIGWLASRLLRADPEQSVFMNVVVGVVGALIGGWLISPLLGAARSDAPGFSPGAVLVALAGAVLLLALVSVFRRGRLR